MSDGRDRVAAGTQITSGVSLLKPLSSGGMGAVWLADHRGLKTRVVVKFMLGGADASDTARARFSREAAAAAQVKSPHVVQMLDHGVTDEGVPFIVMEHLEGRDLGEEIARSGPLDPAKVVAVVTQIARALAKVHAAGLLHRDIKPDNIFLCAGEEDVFAKLLDFGIAKSQDLGVEGGTLEGETKTGQVVGTPFYMSPEQVTAQKTIDQRSDLWSLGVVAYEALTGRRPYDGPSFGALAVKIATGEPPRPSLANAELPSSVDAWFARACARDPAERFASAKEMAEALRAALADAVSLPPSAVVSSGSGPRSLSSSSGARPAPRGDEAPARADADPASGRAATLEFANTAPDTADAARRQAALARSEAGMSVVDGARGSARSSSPWLVGGVAAFAGIVVGVVLYGRPERVAAPERSAASAVAPTAAPGTSIASSAAPGTSIASSSAPGTSVEPATSAAPSAEPATSAAPGTSTASTAASASTSPAAHVDAGVVRGDAVAGADAGARSAAATPSASAGTHALGPGAKASARPGAPGAAHPQASASGDPRPAPTSTEPDLF